MNNAGIIRDNQLAAFDVNDLTRPHKDGLYVGVRIALAVAVRPRRWNQPVQRAFDVPRNIRVRAFIDGNRRRGVRHIQVANAVTHAGRRDNFLHLCGHIHKLRATGCFHAQRLQGILSPERRILACGN